MLATANESGKEDELLMACNLVSETVPYQGLHLQVMLESLTLIEKLQGVDGEDYEDEERFTDEQTEKSRSSRFSSEDNTHIKSRNVYEEEKEQRRVPNIIVSGSGNERGIPLPPSPSFPPPPPPPPGPPNLPKQMARDGIDRTSIVFNFENPLPEPLPEPKRDMPRESKILTRRVSQEEINLADGLQFQLEQLFNASKSRKGLAEDDFTPLSEAVTTALSSDNLDETDIGLMNAAADELERAGLQLELQRRIEDAISRKEKDVETLRTLFCEGNELGMNNFEGMIIIQQLIQRKVQHQNCRQISEFHLALYHTIRLSRKRILMLEEISACCKTL